MIKFKEDVGDFYIYINLDGEYFKIKNADSMILQRATEEFKNGKLRVLIRNK